MIMTEKGILPIGVEFAGGMHREFEIREQLVLDAVEVFESVDREAIKRAEENTYFYNVAVTGRRIVKLGEIPPSAITLDLVLNMHQKDFNEIALADKRLEERRAAFRDAPPQVQGDKTEATFPGQG